MVRLRNEFARNSMSVDVIARVTVLPLGGGGVASVVRAVALLPVDAVLEDAPVAHAGHARVRHGHAPSDHHPPTTVP